jgi:hypothetical protein
MRFTPITSAVVGAVVGGAFFVTTANAADVVPAGSLILAAESGSTTNGQYKVQGTAPHTSTGLGQKTPPAEGLGPKRSSAEGEYEVQGTAPHTSTGLGQAVQPPAQVPDKSLRSGANVTTSETMKGTSEGNVGKKEKKLGEKPTP